MLMDCHRRIEHFLNILCVVVERAGGRTLAEEESAAVQAALQYFRVGGERHTADEEESLFPRLRNGLGDGTFEELGRLEDDHQAAGGLHSTVETLYLSWIADGLLTADETRQLSMSTGRLKHLYGEHIKIEEQIVFPRATQLLNSATIHAIGNEFRKRRA
jgi:iron-sulfur cluster repair protein YtfE (RIC family)